MNCPVCFNAVASDETVRASLNLGILVLMGVTAGVLAGFLRFIVSIARLSNADLKVRLYDDNNHARSTVVEADLQAGLTI
jgi:predicted transporter